MKSGTIQGPIENKKILECSPMEHIAKLIDFYFPYLIKNLMDNVEHQEVESLNEEYNLNILDEDKHQHLIEYFWAIARGENVYDLMFFSDYKLYINFFLQYPLVTGKQMDEHFNFSRILAQYREMELSGYVAQITEEDECYFVYKEDMPEELADIDAEIERYKAQSKMHQADRKSELEGKVRLELMDGTIREGVSWGILPVYTGKDYKIKEVLTLANLDEKNFIQLEEDEIKAIL